ncbi:MAG: cytochrome P460 family protein [Bauldia sp.]|nr:cytochrome P460 family protein [Bauldia sp.]
MRKLIAAAALIGAATAAFAQGAVAPAPNGIAMPEGYKDWRVIGVSARTDNNTLRIIIGNDLAVEAARAGQTNPWPEGTIIGKLVFPQRADPNWAAANVPDGFRHAEFMIKDTTAYASTGGWGYARWLGPEQTPFGADANFAQECFACHVPVASRDYVFTTPAVLP